MTKRQLINALEESYHSDDTQVCVYLKEEEELEDIIGDIAFIDSIDNDLTDRIDINTIYKSYYNGN